MNELFYTKEYLLEQLYALESVNPVKKITQPSDVLSSIQKYAYKTQEHFLSISLNGNHEVIDTIVVSVGLVNRTLVHPREIFRQAIFNNASAIIIAHNHPSGNMQPSAEDVQITKRIFEAGKIVGIEVLDHIIITNKGYYSFLEDGAL
ncbi:MAG: JAB domain-containing protein [Bacteroidota bacterium]|nr:JAB domain-containing protein [Bacteroidota bacterium]